MTIRLAAVAAVMALCAGGSLAACSGSDSPSAVSPSASDPATSASSNPAPASSPDASSNGAAAATSPAPITEYGSASASSLGPLAKQVAVLSALCRRPTPYGYCLADGGALGRAAASVCGRFQSDVFDVAKASQIKLGRVRPHATVLEPGHVAVAGERTWRVVTNCLWTRPGEVAPAIALKLGLIWQPPVIVDCSASPVGTCVQLTPRMFRVDDGANHMLRYRINGVAGGAQLDLRNGGQSSGADRRATQLAAKLLTQLDA
jgi:hypothetical protein